MSKHYKPKGLVNYAGNCYMNSLIQCLYYCIEFRNKILEIDSDEEDSMVFILKELFKEMKTSQNSWVFPSKIKEKLNENELFKNGVGSDATDLLDFIFNSIYCELKPETSITETVDYDRFQSLGVITGKEIPDKTQMEKLFLNLNAAFTKEETTKEEIITIMKNYLPNFEHIETGKSLDSKM